MQAQGLLDQGLLDLIHLLGQRYGVTPEDSSESIPALQVRLTAEPACRPDLQRLIWMPGRESADERQRMFVRRVQEDPALLDVDLNPGRGD